MTPQTHVFECLVPSWGKSLGEIRRCGFGEGVSLGQCVFALPHGV